MSPRPRVLMDADAIDRALDAIAADVLERGEADPSVVLVGIRTRGVPLSERLAEKLSKAAGRPFPLGVLDINLYRDDLSSIADHPVLRSTHIPDGVAGRGVLLVDDVLFTGRTVRAALEALIDLGRPNWIRLIVLVDRGHREVPIRADYRGLEIETHRDQQVEVQLESTDGKERVILIEPEDDACS